MLSVPLNHVPTNKIAREIRLFVNYVENNYMNTDMSKV